VSEVLSPKADELLRQVVALRERYSDWYVPDYILWQALKVDPDTYYDAAKELYDKGLVERQGTDFAALKATPKGMRWVRGV
jgi:Mn-dependent DtxR family transcriptional regulator